MRAVKGIFHYDNYKNATVSFSKAVPQRTVVEWCRKKSYSSSEMVEVWRPIEGITIDELNPTLFIFSFYHKVDVQQVLNGGPWHFDKHMLILGPWHFEALGTRNTCGDAKTWWKWRVVVAPRGR